MLWEDTFHTYPKEIDNEGQHPSHSGRRNSLDAGRLRSTRKPPRRSRGTDLPVGQSCRQVTRCAMIAKTPPEPQRELRRSWEDRPVEHEMGGRPPAEGGQPQSLQRCRVGLLLTGYAGLSEMRNLYGQASQFGSLEGSPSARSDQQKTPGPQ